jgi:putative MATE family efflux protein
MPRVTHHYRLEYHYYRHAKYYMVSQLKATYREIWSIAYPLILGNLAWTMIGMFDTAFMGWLGDPEVARVAQAAIGPISILYSVIFMIGFGYTRGTQILIARHMGEGNPRKVGQIIDNTMALMVVTSVIIFVLVALFSTSFIGWIFRDPKVIAASEEFLRYRIWGVVASFISCVFISFYSGIGRTGILTISVGLMSLINIVLNYLLVFGKGGLPAMGIAGSGLASTLAEWISVIVMIGGVFIKSRKQEFNLFKIRRLNLSLIKHMTGVSTPLVLQSVIANGAWFIFFTCIEKMGGDNLAISSILRQVLMFVGIPVWALGSATNTLVSNLVGQKDLAGVRTAIRRISLISFGMITVQVLLLLLAPRFWMHFFSQDMQLIEHSVSSLWVLGAALTMMSFTLIIFNGVVSVGDTRYAIYVEGLAVGVYCMYFLALFHIPDIMLYHVWTAEWVYWSVMLASSIYLLRRQHIQLW